MPQLVTNGAMLKCPMGSAPATLIVVPPLVTGEKNPVANISDCVPITNIPPFGDCDILSKAAGEVPTPCVPVTLPWAPGSPTVTVRGAPALNNSSICTCTVGGVISITNPGTTRESVA